MPTTNQRIEAVLKQIKKMRKQAKEDSKAGEYYEDFNNGYVLACDAIRRLIKQEFKLSPYIPRKKK